MRLAGKVAIISGAAHGMGAEEGPVVHTRGRQGRHRRWLEAEGNALAASSRQRRRGPFVRTDCDQGGRLRQVVQTTVTVWQARHPGE